ncbi:hypothetical protein SCMU_28800 [Sinomonas cyclohexanicum]|uniref:Polysaccharide pyruvyl transferase domain-containing protein n=1 Tax=Sinomonas cyclohexanicum TaxID=322009 RepID=A0ABM7PXK9_SINCY|nr:polysaccharide pyruvyl transferase family protein [Corynebacterium cyclohexanicum]BCT77038.1 hypothetical protein SCMU_28800 [Corynebacterium cyclohexanicum]
MKVLLLHGYSAENKGDGLLVRESLDLIREALGPGVSVVLAASHPESFDGLGVEVVMAKPGLRGYDRKYMSLLRRTEDFDAIVAVGGGYLRAGRPVEAAKNLLVQGPQLWAASLQGDKAVYLPQSIGPGRGMLRALLASRLKRLHRVWVRDDRSLQEFPFPNVDRSPDLAILGMKRRAVPFDGRLNPVLTVRPLRGAAPRALVDLRERLGRIDSYIQSSVASNDDTGAVVGLEPDRILSRGEFIETNTTARVVIAVRLHAALMALAAGHYVIHLAYERKGFGAFQDLGIDEFVHSVNRFDPDTVCRQAQQLGSLPGLRHDYDAQLRRALAGAATARREVISSLRACAGINAREIAEWA